MGRGSPVLRLRAGTVGGGGRASSTPGRGRRSGGPLAQRLVRALPVVPGQPLRQLPVERGQVRLIPPEQVLVAVEELLLNGAVEPLRVGVDLRRLRVGVVARDPARRQQDGEPALLLRAVVGEHPVHRPGEQVEGEVGEVPGPAGGHPRRGPPVGRTGWQVEAGEQVATQPCRAPRSRCPPPAPPRGVAPGSPLACAASRVAGRLRRPRLSRRGGTARSPPASAISRPMVTTATQRNPRRSQNRSRSGRIFRFPKLGAPSEGDGSPPSPPPATPASGRPMRTPRDRPQPRRTPLPVRRPLPVERPDRDPGRLRPRADSPCRSRKASRSNRRRT